MEAPVAQCSDQPDPDAYCAATFGAGHVCRPSSAGSRCVRVVCTSDAQCSALEGPCRGATCAEVSQVCEVSPRAKGTPCEDGYACTESFCDEAGSCIGLPQNGRCGPGEICQPACFGGPSGCGVPPTDLEVTCEEDKAGSADCTITLDPAVTGQAACLACTAEVGYRELSFADFSDSSGACAEDGWALVSGASCSDSVAGCNPLAGTATCCDDFSTICSSRGSGRSLQSVFEENCGGGVKQWRITRSFTGHGLTDLRLCFDAREAYAGANDAVLAVVSDGASRSEPAGCMLGSDNWRAGFRTICSPLPDWTFGDGSFEITLIGHNNAARAGYPDEVKSMGLDNVLIYGVDPSCGVKRVTVLSEDFTGCQNAIADGWNGWSVEGEPTCSTAACSSGGPAALAQGSSWTLTRYVDTSSLAGDIQLCLQAGNVAAANQDLRFRLAVDTGDGTGWHSAGWGSVYAAPDNQCETICFNISAVNPVGTRTPNLGLMLSLASPNDTWQGFIDEIAVSGIESCPADGRLAMGEVAEVGGGSYRLTMSNVAAARVNAQLRCAWRGTARAPAGIGYLTIDVP